MHAGNVYSLVERTLFEALLLDATSWKERPHIGSDEAASTREALPRQPRNPTKTPGGGLMATHMGHALDAVQGKRNFLSLDNVVGDDYINPLAEVRNAK